MAKRRSVLSDSLNRFRGKVSKLASLWAGEARFNKGVILPEREAVLVHRTIAYSRLAKKIISSNPGLIRTFLKARKAIGVSRAKSAKVGSIEVTDLSKSSSGLVANGYYKLSVNGRHFFVKESLRKFPKAQFDAAVDSPVAQATAAKKAATVIKRYSAFKDHFVVAQPHFIFQGTDKMFLAMDFYEGKTLDEYFPSVEPGVFTEEFKRSAVFRDNYFKISRLKDTLNRNGVFDVSNKNIIWCPSLEKFVLVDLRYQ